MHPSAGLFFDPETELGVQDGTKRETQGGRGFGHKALETRRVGESHVEGREGACGGRGSREAVSGQVRGRKITTGPGTRGPWAVFPLFSQRIPTVA